MRETLRQFGPGTALFSNGDYIAGPDALESDIESLINYFPEEASVRRLFIDEITAVAGSQKAIIGTPILDIDRYLTKFSWLAPSLHGDVLMSPSRSREPVA